MAFGELGISKKVAENSPKYRRIVEPFGDSGTFALFLAKKPAKTHLLNIVDETRFALLTFMKEHTAADKRTLKSRDWVSSPEAFDAAAATAATDGPDLYYRYMYLKKFAAKSKDPEAPPAYDWLTFGHDMGSIVYGLPLAKVGLKKVEIVLGDPFTVMGSASGSDTFVILVPKTPEDVTAVEAKLPLSSPFFFAKKVADNQVLFDDAAATGDVVSHMAASSIMMATFEVRTNYDTKLPIVDPTLVA